MASISHSLVEGTDVARLELVTWFNPLNIRLSASDDEFNYPRTGLTGSSMAIAI